MLTQRAEVLNQYHVAMSIPWQPGDSYILSTPMFHGATMLGIAGAPMFGVPVVIQPMFDPAGFMAACETYHCTTTVLVPTMIGMIVNHPEFACGADLHPQAAALRRLADAEGAAGEAAGDAAEHADRPGLRHDRGGDRPDLVLRRRPPRRVTAGLLRTRRTRGPAQDRRRGRQRTPGRRAGRGVRPRRQLHDRLPQAPRGDREGLPGRLVRLRGRRLPRRGGLPVPGRPRQGHDHLRWGEHLLGRGGERGRLAPRGAAGRRHRYPARDLGRGGARDLS